MTTLASRARWLRPFCRGKIINLCNYENLDEEGAQVLAASNRDVWLPDVHGISLSVAEILAQHKGELSLDGIEDLPPKIARALAQHEGDLSFLSVAKLSDESAMALASHEGSVHLLMLQQLSPQAGHLALAKKLAAQNGPLFLLELYDLSLAAAVLLSQHEGEITLALQYVTDEMSEALSNHEGKINLPAECEMSEHARDLLVNCTS